MRKRLIEGMRAKVHYGRATLTVHRSVVVLGSPIGEALKAYRRKEIDAEEVAWRFLRGQSVEHSPTFDWATANLLRLLPLVTAVMREPELKAQTPEELVAELQRVENEQEAAKKRLSEQLRQFAFPGASYLRTIQKAQRDLEAFSRPLRMLQQQQETLQRATQPFRTINEFAQSQARPLEQIQSLLRPTASAFSALGISQTAFRQLLGQGGINALADLQKNPFLEQDWRPVFEQVAEVARDEDAPEIAEAVEAAAHEAEKEESEVDFEQMQRAIERLSDQLEESNRLERERAERKEAAGGEEGSNDSKNEPSISKAVLVQFSMMVIRWMIESVFGIDFGFDLGADPSDLPQPSEDAPLPHLIPGPLIHLSQNNSDGDPPSLS